MGQKENAAVAAVIDIGSSAMRMKVAQIKKGHLEEMDVLEYPVNFGHETFTTGRISFAATEEACKALEGFVKSAGQYGVEQEDIRITATTAIREAQNSAHVVDRFSIRAGNHVEVLGDREEKSLIFRELLRRIDGAGYGQDREYLMAYIGSGSLGLAVVRDGSIVYSRNLSVGSLRLSQMLEDLDDTPSHAFRVLEEYLDTASIGVAQQLEEYNLSGLVLCGREIVLIAHLAEDDQGNSPYVDREDLKRLYDAVKTRTPEELRRQYALTEEQSETLVPALTIYLKLCRFVRSSRVMYSSTTTSDCLLFDMLFPVESREYQDKYDQSIAASAWDMALRYRVDEAHTRAVERYAMLIFDDLRKLHGFSRRERLLLQAAAILHDTGQFVDTRHHERQSCQLILHSNIAGLLPEETALVGYIAQYHGIEEPAMSDGGYAQLGLQDRLTVSKLAAILRLADALDYSHVQKLEDISVEQKSGELLVHALTTQDTALEEMIFRRKAGYFTEVFGVQCRLKVKRGI